MFDFTTLGVGLALGVVVAVALRVPSIRRSRASSWVAGYFEGRSQPGPRTTFDKVWLGVGVVAGILLLMLFLGYATHP